MYFISQSTKSQPPSGHSLKTAGIPPRNRFKSRPEKRPDARLSSTFFRNQQDLSVIVQKDLRRAYRGVEALVLAVRHAPYLDLRPKDTTGQLGRSPLPTTSGFCLMRTSTATLSWCLSNPSRKKSAHRRKREKLRRQCRFDSTDNINNALQLPCPALH